MRRRMALMVMAAVSLFVVAGCTNNPNANPKVAAHEQLAWRGMGEDQYQCLVTLWDRESGWNLYATNPSSGAYGIPQALPGEKMGTVAGDWRTSAAAQINWGLTYIQAVYGTPCGALAHSNSFGWY